MSYGKVVTEDGVVVTYKKLNRRHDIHVHQQASIRAISPYQASLKKCVSRKEVHKQRPALGDKGKRCGEER
jgi:hypothetical protein